MPANHDVIKSANQRVRIRALAEAPTVATLIRRSPDRALVDEAGSIAGRLVPWDTPATVADEDGRRYRESFARGGLQPPTDEVIPVYAGHVYVRGRLERGPLVGRLDDIESRDDGLYGRVVLADVPAAAELRALARTVGATFSVEFEPGPGEPADEVIRTAATMSGLAVLTAPQVGAYPGAQVLEVRAAPTDPDPEGDEGDEGEGDEGEGGDGDPAGVEGVGPPAARAAIRREVERIIGRRAVPTAAHPLARFTSAYEFHAAARASDSDELAVLFANSYRDHHARLAARAWVDQITTDNPGVMPPGWLTEVFGIIDMGRPVISTIGTRPLPAEGMEVDWPYFDGDLHTLVGVQATEKTEITSVKVSLKKASTAITTYAGGSDLSWQLIRRSSPSYRDSYLRIMQAAFGVVTDAAATAALNTAAGAGTALDVSTDTDGAKLRAAVFAASAKVQVATGQPASYVLASKDVFAAFAALPSMMPSPYGTQNVSGVATASTLDVNVSGLRVTLAPDLPAKTAIISNQLATAWMEDGPFVVTAPEVNKLGEDVAIWGMGAFGAFLAAGLVKLTFTLPPPVFADEDTTTTTSSKSSKSSS